MSYVNLPYIGSTIEPYDISQQSHIYDAMMLDQPLGRDEE